MSWSRSIRSKEAEAGIRGLPILLPILVLGNLGFAVVVSLGTLESAQIVLLTVRYPSLYNLVAGDFPLVTSRS